MFESVCIFKRRFSSDYIVILIETFPTPRTHMRRNFIVVFRGLFDIEATATIADVEAEIAIEAAVAATSFGRVG